MGYQTPSRDLIQVKIYLPIVMYLELKRVRFKIKKPCPILDLGAFERTKNLVGEIWPKVYRKHHGLRIRWLLIWGCAIAM